MKYFGTTLLFVVLLNVAHAQTRKANILLITGTGNTAPNHHYADWTHAHYNDILADALKDIAKITATTDLSMLNDTTLRDFDIILNNSLFMEPTAEQFRAFYKFIENGKSYFSVHAGLVSFLNSEQYLQMMGARFINHDDAKTFTVNAYDAWYGWEAQDKKQKHAIAKDVDDFKILDELYLAQFSTSDIEVIARAEFHPIMWTRPWKKGRVLCLTLGHGDYSQRNPGFQKLLFNGVAWLLNQQETE